MASKVFKIIGVNMKLSLEDFMEEVRQTKVYKKVYLVSGSNYVKLLKELDKIEPLIKSVELDDEYDMVILTNGIKVDITEVAWDLLSLKKTIKYLQKLSQLEPKNKLQVLSYIDIRRLKLYDNTFRNTVLTLEHKKLYVAKGNVLVAGNYRFYKTMKKIIDLNLKSSSFMYIVVKSKEFDPNKLKEFVGNKDYVSILITKKGITIKEYGEDHSL